MDLDALATRFDQLEHEFHLRMAPLNRFLDENLKRVNHPGGLTPFEFDRQRREVLRQVGNGETPLHALLDGLCPAYLEASAADRQALRAAVQSRRSMPDRVRAYAEMRAQSIRSPLDVDTLYAALAAMSIENCAQDYRDTLLALAEIYVRAERAGVDPQPHFDSVAGLSSAEVPRGGSTPVARMLRDFHGYAVLAERRGKP